MNASLFLVILGGVFALGCCIFSLLDHSGKGRLCSDCNHLIFHGSRTWRSGLLAARAPVLSPSRFRAGA